MATLKQQAKRAQKLNSEKIVKAIFDFIRSIEADIVALNKEQLNKDSTDIFGDAIGFYSKATEYITTNDALLGGNSKIKRAGEPYDMDDTGAFLKGLKMTIANNVVIFSSTDPKTDLILENPNLLSTELFGLTDKNLQKVIRKFILPFYLQYSRKALRL